MSFFIALLPIIFIFVFLFLFKLPSLRASLFTFMLTIAVTFFCREYHLNLDKVIHESIQGILISFIAGYVLFFGIFLYHLIQRVGGIQSIASFISERISDRVVQVLVLVVGLSPLIESTSGFGVAFMMVAPIFTALGFTPMKAALLGLVSLLAVPWGALATGTIIGAELGELSLERFGFGTAIVSIPVFAYFIIIAVWIVGGKEAVKRKWKQIGVIFFAFTSSILFCNYFISVELAGVLSSLLVIILGFVMTKKGGKGGEHISGTDKEKVIKVFSPYIILTILIFMTRVISPFQEILQRYAVIDLPKFSYKLALLYSPGFWLLITCIAAIVIFRLKKEEVFVSFKKTVAQWIPFMITTSCFVGISEVMGAAGMITAISDTLGSLFGKGFLVISVLIGALGGFLTGSTASSNAMFIKLQVQTAGLTGLSADLVAFSQNAGASHTTMASPSRVMLGTRLLGIQSKEHQILKTIFLVVLGALLLIVAMSFGLSFFYF